MCGFLLLLASPTLPRGWRYRVAQLVAALRARVQPAEHTLAALHLAPAELRLFLAMPRYDQRHCLDVFGTLVAAGYTDPLLLRAALVHDCGKVDDDGRPMALGWYVVNTILQRMPGLYLACAHSERGPLRAVHLYAAHAWRGAAMLVAAGSPSELVSIVRHYHDPSPQGLAALLQWADAQH